MVRARFVRPPCPLDLKSGYAGPASGPVASVLRVTTAEEQRGAVRIEASRLEDGTKRYEQAHRLARDYWARLNAAVGGLTVLSGAVSAAASLPDDSKPIAVTASLMAAGGGAILTFLKPAERAEQHRAATQKLSHIRGELRRLQLQHLDTAGAGELRRRLQIMADDRAELLQIAPGYTQRVYRKADTQVKRGVLDTDVPGTQAP